MSNECENQILIPKICKKGKYKMLDIRTGQQWGVFLILEEILNKRGVSGTRCFKTQCIKCGTISTKGSAYLNKYKDNYCCIHCIGENHMHFQGIGELTGELYCIIQQGCTRGNGRTLDFNISKEFLWELFLKQNRKCALSGLDLILSKRNRTASLDRIDSSKGYIEKNVQWVHKDINRMKMDLNQERFLELCNLINKYRNE